MKPTKKNKPAREKSSGKDLPSKGSRTFTGTGKGELSEKNVADKIRKNQDADEELQPGRTIETDSDDELPAKTTEEALDLDEDIRNDIFHTEVNPHAIKRSPLNKKRHGAEDLGLNEDSRIINEQEDDNDESKYKDV